MAHGDELRLASYSTQFNRMQAHHGATAVLELRSAEPHHGLVRHGVRDAERIPDLAASLLTGALPAQRTQALSVSTSGLAAAKRQQSASGQQAAAHRESMNAICAAGARTAAERPATTAAPLKAGAWKGSRRYIICAAHRGPTGGQAGRSVPDFCRHASALRALSEEGHGHGIPRRCWICG